MTHDHGCAAAEASAGPLHDALLAGCRQQRAVLLARPEAPAALAAYAKWGYHTHGELRPAPGAPVYLAMSRELG